MEKKVKRCDATKAQGKAGLTNFVSGAHTFERRFSGMDTDAPGVAPPARTAANATRATESCIQMCANSTTLHPLREIH